MKSLKMRIAAAAAAFAMLETMGVAAAAESPVCENVQPAAAAVQAEEQSSNAPTGKKTNYVLSGTLLVGAIAALIITRKKDK